MKNNYRQSEINKLWIITIVFLSTIILNIYIKDNDYSAALLGIAGSMVGLGAFQLHRLMTFDKEPSLYDKEAIEIQDERNQFIIQNSKIKSYNFEIYPLLLITFYAIYSKDTLLAILILILWISRVLVVLFEIHKLQKKY